MNVFVMSASIFPPETVERRLKSGGRVVLEDEGDCPNSSGGGEGDCDETSSRDGALFGKGATSDAGPIGERFPGESLKNIGADM